MEEQKSVQENTEKKNTSEVVMAEGSVAIIDEQTIRDKIYTIRGVQVMLDFELAEIYGYTTSAFNQQVKRNENRFPDDFRFQLTVEEAQILRSQNVTASWGGDRREPWAFTESGIYMLMSVLKGDLAVQQSIALIRTFKAMKDYIVEGRAFITQQDYLRLSMQMTDTTQELRLLQEKVDENTDQINKIMVRLDDTVRSSELPLVILDLGKPEEQQQLLILNGQLAKAAETYIDIYAAAKTFIIIVDNYIDIKTLRLLQRVGTGVSVTILSDNIGNRLHLRDVNDFHTEFPEINVNFFVSGGIMHDRFIVLDFGTGDEKMYHCGASAKDAGNKMTAIMEITDSAVKSAFGTVITDMLGNSALLLR